jgi:hypothetical protein
MKEQLKDRPLCGIPEHDERLSQLALDVAALTAKAQQDAERMKRLEDEKSSLTAMNTTLASHIKEERQQVRKARCFGCFFF